MFKIVANAQPVTVDLSALSAVEAVSSAWTSYEDADGEPVCYVETETGLTYVFRDVLAAT